MSIAIRDLPTGDVSGTAQAGASEPPRAAQPDAVVEYVQAHFEGTSYLRPPRQVEPDPAVSLALLAALADQRAAGLSDYPDSPEAAQRRSHVTEALYAAQLESLAQRDD